MTSGPLVLYHIGLLILPLAALALMRFRLTPAVLLMAVLHHHPMEPMPGDHDPPPICCALAQSTEAGPGRIVVAQTRTLRLRHAARALIAPPLAFVKPAIRAPPATLDSSTPAPWVPELRAA